MKKFTDKDGVCVTPEALESGIDFTSEEYGEILEKDSELRTFEELLDECIRITEEQNGTLEDAVFLANASYEDLSEKLLHEQD